MTKYSHQCSKCGELFEVVRTVDKRDSPARCPKCKSRKTKRLISSPNVIYVGDGFTKSTTKT